MGFFVMFPIELPKASEKQSVRKASPFPPPPIEVKIVIPTIYQFHTKNRISFE